MPKKQRLDQYDTIQAIIRHPQYIKDCEAWSKIAKQKVYPKYIKERNAWLRAKHTRPHDYLVPFIATKKVRRWRIPLVSDLENLRKHPICLYYYAKPIVELNFLDSYSRPQMSPENCSYITIKIDLQYPQSKILKDIKYIVEHYHGLTESPKNRMRETTIDPWKIYDMHHEKSLLKITKEIYGLKRNPAYDSKAKNRYDLVRRAYQKARRMIQAVTPT